MVPTSVPVVETGQGKVGPKLLIGSVSSPFIFSGYTITVFRVYLVGTPRSVGQQGILNNVLPLSKPSVQNFP